MNRRMRALRAGAATLAILLGARFVLAADPHFERIGPTRGLLAGEISAVTQDRVGLLWLGTREGLLLYDGYGFRVFEKDPDRDDSLADNWIRAIHEDREGHLWIGTNGGGLDLLDRASWTFVHHRHDPDDPASIPDNGVFAVLQDRQGTLWIGTRKGLVRRGASDPGFRPTEVEGWVIDLLEDAAGGMWVATFGDGVYHRAEAGGAFRPVPVQVAPADWRPQRARCLAQDVHGTVWAGVAGGLLRFDPSSAAFRGVAIPIGPGGPGGLPTASDLAADPGGTLWVGTPGGGLVAMDPKTGEGIRYSSRPGAESGLSSDNVQAMYLGRDGTLWIGTGEGTLNQLRADADLFTIPRASLAEQDFGFGSAVAEDGRGKIWLGSFGKGVDILDPVTGATRASDLLDSTDTGERAVTVLFPSAAGGAWVGTPVGLARLDGDGRVERWWKHDANDAASLGAGYVAALREARDGAIWVGTTGSGLFRMRDDRSGFDRYPVADGFVSAILEGADGTFWIGTRSSGLAVLPPGAARPLPYGTKPEDLSVLGKQSVSSLLEDGKGSIWVGTLGGGLFRIDRTGGEVRVSRLGEAEGLVDQNVAAVLEDDDGLPSPTFNVGSAWRGASSLHFGTKAGLVSIRRGTPFPSPTPSPVALTSLRTLEGPVTAGRPVWDVDAISIL